MLGLVGVTAMETSAAGVTVKVVLPVIPPELAVIVVAPGVSDVAKPMVPGALLMVATDVEDELQITVVVRFCVVPSSKVPVAVNCWLVPKAMLGLVGVTAMETSAAGVTVKVVLPVIPLELAVIVVAPGVSDVAKPMDPAELSIVAIDVEDELQLTRVVTSFVVPSEYIPVAVSC
jgi:hypothetical protein